MSTVKRNTIINRFGLLVSLGEDIFHTDDLANIWKISNKNTLHTTLKRYVQAGFLERIYRGFYSIKPIEKLDKFALGLKALHSFAYVSTETVLTRAGIMQQSIDLITMISSKSISFSIGDYHYKSRQLSDKFLYQDLGVKNENGVKVASVERAVADMLYFNPKAYFDGARLIDWKKVKEIQKKLAYK